MNIDKHLNGDIGNHRDILNSVIPKTEVIQSDTILQVPVSRLKSYGNCTLRL